MLVLDNVTKYFHRGGVNEVLALDGLGLHVNAGDFVTVIGSNGAGKSTTLNCIAGCFFPDKGSITLDGRDITGLPEYERARFIGRVFQDPLMGSAAKLSIEENLALADRRGKWRGLAPGVNMSEKLAFFEATHGTAPTIAGLDKANPGSLVLCGAMMLEHLQWFEAAKLIHDSMDKTISAKTVTVDLAGQIPGSSTVGCTAFGELLQKNL